MSALSAAQRKANDKYFKDHYTQVKLSMPNAEAAAMDAYCKAHGLTKAGFIRDAIREKMERDLSTAADVDIMAGMATDLGITIEDVASAVDFGRAIDVIDARIPGAKDLLLSDKINDYISEDQKRYLR